MSVPYIGQDVAASTERVAVRGKERACQCESTAKPHAPFSEDTHLTMSTAE